MKPRAYSYRKIWTTAWPILVSLIMEQMIGLTDTAFLGRVSEIDLGASAIGGVFYNAIFMLGLGFGLGAQVIIGRRNGEGSLREIGKVFHHGLYFLLTLGVAIILVSELAAPPVLSRIVDSPDIAAAASSYVRWRLPGMICAFCTVMYRAFFIGTVRTSTLTANSIVMVVSNIGFNWVLIFGKLGFPALGITGAAIGSSLAELVSLVFFFVYTRCLPDRRAYGLDRLSRFDGRLMKEMLDVSVWTMIEGFLSVSTWLLFFLFIEHHGERDLAVSNIIRSVSGVIWMAVEAFSSTTTTLVSIIIGEGRENEVGCLIRKIMSLCYGFIAVILVLVAMFPESVIRVFTDMEDLVPAAVPILFVLCGSYVLTIPGNILWNASMGTGNTKTTFALEAVCLGVYIVYCWVVILRMKAPLAVCWTADYVYAACMAAIYAAYMISGRWKSRKI